MLISGLGPVWAKFQQRDPLAIHNPPGKEPSASVAEGVRLARFDEEVIGVGAASVVAEMTRLVAVVAAGGDGVEDVPRELWPMAVIRPQVDRDMVPTACPLVAAIIRACSSFMFFLGQEVSYVLNSNSCMNQAISRSYSPPNSCLVGTHRRLLTSR